MKIDTLPSMQFHLNLGKNKSLGFIQNVTDFHTVYPNGKFESTPKMNIHIKLFLMLFEEQKTFGNPANKHLYLNAPHAQKLELTKTTVFINSGLF